MGKADQRRLKRARQAQQRSHATRKTGKDRRVQAPQLDPQQVAMMAQVSEYHASLLHNHTPDKVTGIMNRIGLDDPAAEIKIADIALAAAGMLFVCLTSLPEAEHQLFMGAIARHVGLLDDQRKRQQAARPPAPAPDATVIRAAPASPMQADPEVIRAAPAAD